MASKACITLIDGLLDTFKDAKPDTLQKRIQTNEVKQYKWDWNEKLNASPFRKERKRLKQDSKTNPSSKSSNNEFKRRLKAKEKELLIEFQMKCDQAKIWINEAHQQYNDEHNVNHDDIKILKQIAIQLKQEKVDVIDKLWNELICHQTVFIQNEKIKRQKQQMAALDKQLKEQQNILDQLDEKDKFVNNDTQNVIKKKRKQKKESKYKGLIGYFNKPSTNTNNKKHKKKEKETEVKKEEVPMGFASFSMVPRLDENEEKQKQTEKEKQKQTEKEKETKPEIKEIKKNKSKPKVKKGSMKGGFLKSGTNGLYDDKKLDSELTVPELNIKNRKQIEEMGFADAVDNPLFTWKRPKQETQ